MGADGERAGKLPVWFEWLVGVGCIVGGIAGLLALHPFGWLAGTTRTHSSSASTTSSVTIGTGGVPASVSLSAVKDPPSSNIDAVVDQPITLDGQTYAQTVQLQGVHGPNCSGPAFITFPVHPGETKLTGTYGWTANTEPGSSDQLIVYGNSTNTKPLWSQAFTNPGLPPVAKTLTVRGNNAVIFEFLATGGDACGIDSHGSNFVLADAQLTS